MPNAAAPVAEWLRHRCISTAPPIRSSVQCRRIPLSVLSSTLRAGVANRIQELPDFHNRLVGGKTVRQVLTGVFEGAFAGIRIGAVSRSTPYHHLQRDDVLAVGQHQAMLRQSADPGTGSLCLVSAVAKRFRDKAEQLSETRKHYKLDALMNIVENYRRTAAQMESMSQFQDLTVSVRIRRHKPAKSW